MSSGNVETQTGQEAENKWRLHLVLNRLPVTPTSSIKDNVEKQVGRM